jgi:hypothetical protein
MPFDNGSPSSYTAIVTIGTDGGDIVVSNTFSTMQKQGIYFYYPDSRAKHVVIKKGGTQILNTGLTEHPNLNGAYYFAGVSPSMDEPTSASGNIPTVTQGTPTEMLANYVITSEVNNPFVFRAAGYFKVGTGKILGMSSITQALSEGQFGQFPLLVFSESGIWALSVASTGYYDSIHPISREVSNDPACLIQTDGAVFFTSDKGLMVVVGSQVKCVSEQLSGKDISFKVNNVEQTAQLGNFQDYLKNCFIAYDYRDSLLWIFNGSSRYCYVYSIKSGTFGKYDFGSSSIITNVVNDYPDYLLQSGDKLYSLTGRPNVNLDYASTNPNVYNRYTGKIITRPMKLENALALKSIMQMKHIHEIPGLNKTGVSYPTLTLRMFGSNNLTDWVELASLRGTPWKYYRFYYSFTNLIATDRFAGTVLVTQERRIDKIR